MVDFTPSIKTAIETATGLTCYLELDIGKASIPCVTIIQDSNPSREEGDTIRYSYPTYTIKVYEDVYADLVEYCLQIDDALFTLGYKREGTNTLKYDKHLAKILNYGALVVEK